MSKTDITNDRLQNELQPLAKNVETLGNGVPEANLFVAFPCL